MPTYDSKQIIDDLVRNSGRYPGDPQAVFICSYINMTGNTAYFVAYNRLEIIRLSSSEYVRDIVPLWTRSGINITIESGIITSIS